MPFNNGQGLNEIDELNANCSGRLNVQLFKFEFIINMHRFQARPGIQQGFRAFSQLV
jgi:hypothetical protein